MNYNEMVVEAVIAMDEKHGSSLPGIRKYILNNYINSKKSVASFNNLTMKALTKAVAENQLEMVSRAVYRLSWVEKERRKKGEGK